MVKVFNYYFFAILPNFECLETILPFGFANGSDYPANFSDVESFDPVLPFYITRHQYRQPHGSI